MQKVDTNAEVFSEPGLGEQARQEGKARQLYADSIESLVRNNIQKLKIDMANEVIDAGRFDMRTSMEERKHTLESMLQVCPATYLCRSTTGDINATVQTYLSSCCCSKRAGEPPPPFCAMGNCLPAL